MKTTTCRLSQFPVVETLSKADKHIVDKSVMVWGGQQSVGTVSTAGVSPGPQAIITLPTPIVLPHQGWTLLTVGLAGLTPTGPAGGNQKQTSPLTDPFE